jgi:hypothetical protein
MPAFKDTDDRHWRAIKADWKHSNETQKRDMAEAFGNAKEYVKHKMPNSAQLWKRGTNSRVLDKIFGKERPLLPICPYGCGREGTLLEVVMMTDGKAMGIFNDYPCSCIFVAEIQLPPNPNERKQKIAIVNGEPQVVDDDAE